MVEATATTEIEVDGVAAVGEMDGETNGEIAGEIHMAAADGVNHGICGGEDAKQTQTDEEWNHLLDSTT